MIDTRWIGLLPIAVAAIGASYAWLILSGARSRDNRLFGALAILDASMSAWRGLTVLTGGALTDRRVLVACSLGTIVLSVVTIEFLAAFPRCRPLRRELRMALLGWAGLAVVLVVHGARDPWGQAQPVEWIFFAPSAMITVAIGAMSLRRTSAGTPTGRAERVVIAMLMGRWVFGFATYYVGPLIGRFEEMVWLETTAASLVGFVVVGTSILRTELFSLRQATAEVIARATLVLLTVLGGGAAVAAALRFAPPGEVQAGALFVAAFVPLYLATVGKRLYPRLEKRVLAPLDDRRARRLGVQDEPLPVDRDAAIDEACRRIAAFGDGSQVRWELAGALPADVTAELGDRPIIRAPWRPDAPACLAVPAIAADGRVLGAFLIDGGTLDRDTYLVARDLAARVALVVERAAAVSALEDARRLAALGQFAAAIAHDIRTPLTSISLNVQILRRKLALSPDDAEHLDIALEELARLDRSVAEILDFAKPVRLHAEPIDVRELLDTAAQTLSPVLAEKRLALRCEAADAPRVVGDRQRLKQVLVNLVDNAANASQPGAEVTVRASRADREVAIAIADRGRGIASADLARIFEPFFTTRPDGTGLGLAIVHKVIEAHGGRMEVRSTIGEGSTFTIVLPGS